MGRWGHIKPSKFKNVSQKAPCHYGHKHRSLLEHSVCNLIWLKETKGQIKCLKHQDRILLSGWYLYIADFKVQDCETEEIYWIEAKGKADIRWPSTKKGWRHCGPGRLEIWSGHWKRPTLKQIILTKSDFSAIRIALRQYDV